MRLRHLLGDQREHFSTLGDIWQIVRALAEERRRREIDPTLSVLRELIMETPASETDRYAQARLREMHDLIELIMRWSEDVQKLDTGDLVQLLKLGGRVVALLELKNRLPLIGRNLPQRATGHAADADGGREDLHGRERTLEP